jgi:D-amino-acid dehydrogenase
MLRDLGLNLQWLDVEETLEKEPLLASIRDRMAGAIFYPDDESGDARAFTIGLTRACEAAGVRFEWHTPVKELMDRAGHIIGVRTHREEIEVEAVVLATGHDTWRLLRPLGLHLPVRPVKGYSLSLDMSGLNERPSLPVVDEALHAIATPMGDRLRVAGTAEIAGTDRTLRQERVDNLRQLLRRLYPDIAETLLAGEQNPWCGFRPMSADGRPFIGETRAKGLWLTTGHGHLGWTQAMGSGDVLAAQMSGETPAIDTGAFAAARI